MPLTCIRLSMHLTWQDAKDADESAAEERGEAEEEVSRLGDGETPLSCQVNDC